MAFARGARPSPPHILLAARPHQVVTAAPPQFAVVPKKLSMWKNNEYGCCVTSEEAFAKAWWSVRCGLPELLIPDAEVMRWADTGGFLNGADLVSVMDAMIHKGFLVNGVTYGDGRYGGVDYSNEMVLQNAIFTGPVKIAIDADALPSSAGNQQGWYDVSGTRYTNTDHCVGLSGYGRADYLFQQLGVALPAGLAASTPGYLLFTWSSLGFVTHPWLMGTCVESWVRNPTTPGQSPPAPPTPPKPPAPPPSPDPTIHSTRRELLVGLTGKVMVQVDYTGPVGSIKGIKWA